MAKTPVKMIRLGGASLDLATELVQEFKGKGYTGTYSSGCQCGGQAPSRRHSLRIQRCLLCSAARSTRPGRRGVNRCRAGGLVSRQGGYARLSNGVSPGG